MLNTVVEMIVGWEMAFIFGKVLSWKRIESSLFDDQGAKSTNDIIKKAQEKDAQINLQSDYLCAEKITKDAQIYIRTIIEGIDDG